MRIVMRGYRKFGDLVPGISQHELRLIRPRGLRDRELVVEARQPRSTGQDEPAAGDGGDVEIGYLVETSREQPSRRILRHGLAFGAGREGEEKTKAPRSRKRGGRTQRHGIHSPSGSPKFPPLQRAEPDT